MKNKILTIIAIVLAFIAGAELVLVLTKNKNTTKNGDEKSLVYNSCSNCMSGTTVVENGGLTQTINKVYDAVVMIKVYKNNVFAGSGSGFVYKADDDYGYVMTNEHVVSGSSKIEVRLASGEVVEATLLGSDKYIDIAVLRIPKKYVISVAKIGTTEELHLGDSVATIGTPVGENYFNTVTGGHISGLDRKVTVTVNTTNDWVQDVIQIDASINPGNSGGALVNFNGEVIGVTSLKLINSSIEGMGFAIKIDDAMKHIDTLEEGKEIERPFLGISHANVTDKLLLARYGVTLDESITEGIVVVTVEEGSSAEEAGLKPGDVITKIDDDKVANSAYLKYVLYKHNVGDEISITYIRGKDEHTVEITLANPVEE